MIPQYLKDAQLVEEFNPEGDGFDYKTALDSGIEPDNAKNLGNIDPRNGLILKGKNNPDWAKTVEEETKLGNTIVKSDSGRYYSTSMPQYLSKAKLAYPNPEQEEDDAKLDFDFAMQEGLPVGFFETIGEEWLTPERFATKLPFYGGVVSMSEKINVAEKAQRLIDNKYVSTDDPGFYKTTKEDVEYAPFTLKDKEYDKKVVSAYLKYIATNRTTFGKIAQGVSVLPAWMIEFYATGGLASLGDDVAVLAGKKILQKYSEQAIGKLALKAAGWSTGAATRSFGLLHRVGDQTAQKHLETVLGLKEREGWATDILKSWGDVYIEAASESAGEGITKGGGWLIDKLPFGAKMTSALEKAWITATGGTKGEFVRKLASQGGYSNILGEIGEERLGTILRAIANVDDFGAGKDSTLLERLKYGVIQDAENIFVEIGVLAAPMAGQYILSKTTGEEKTDKIIGELQAKDAEKQQIIDKINREIGGKEENVPENPEVVNEINAEAEKDDKKTEEISPIPPTVEKANYSNEIDAVSAQLVTGRADPSLSSARQFNLNEDRAALGLDGIPSAERKTWQKTLQQAKDEGVADNALRIASEVNSKPRPLNDTETAGLVIKAAQLKAEHRSIQDKISKATEPAAIALLNTQSERVELEFESLTSALHKSGTEKGRTLASQKLTINQDLDLVSVLTRAKQKRGKELTKIQREKFEKLTQDLEQAQKEIDRLTNEVAEMMANNFIKQKKTITRIAEMNKTQRQSEIDGLVDKAQKLLKEGC